MYVYINGKFVENEQARISVFDRGFLFGEGVFETIAAVNGEIFFLDEHIDRILSGCHCLELDVPWSSNELIHIVQKTLEFNAISDARIRVNITLTASEPTLLCAEGSKPQLVVFVTPLQFAGCQVHERGIKLMSMELERCFPKIKSLNFLPSVIGYRKASNCGFDDALFVDKLGHILETTVSNIFVAKDGILKTPVDGVLLGITRNKVIELAKSIGVNVSEAQITLEELYNADEAFVSGTIKKIMPVISVDDNAIGNAKVGDTTKLLMRKFSELYY